MNDDEKKVVPWERLQQDVTIKVLTEDECNDIMIRMYPNARDYKLYVMSRCIYDFIKLIKHMRLYSSHYGVEYDILLDELFKLALAVNPYLSTKFTKSGSPDHDRVGCALGTQEEESKQKERFDDVPTDKILSLGDKVTSRVLGQDKAIEKVILAIQRASVGLRDPLQPIGSFMLTGPTGVGKTLLAKILAEELIGSTNYLVRVDCSEYQQRHETSKLIGAPHGYIGYEQGGILTNAMKEAPFSIVLFDEIEKAHEKVYNLLLQIMDEGHLTSNTGENIPFNNSIILMTSNLGVSEVDKITSEVGFEKARSADVEDRIAAMERALAKKFRPEFLNRIDAVSHFMPLNDEDICKEIVVLELDMLLQHLYTNKKLTVHYSPEVVAHIYDKGFDEEFGARPLKRAIRKYFADVLSEMLLHTVVTEGSTLVATMKSGRIVFTVGDNNVEGSVE